MSDDSPLGLGVDDAARAKRHGPSAAARRVGYLVTFAVNLGVLYLANGVPNWDVPVITNAWPDVLWAINLSLLATIVANLAFLVYDARWFQRGLQLGLTCLSIVVFHALYTVFPFDLGNALYEQIARWALLAGMLGLSIALVVGVVVLIVGRDR